MARCRSVFARMAIVLLVLSMSVCTIETGQAKPNDPTLILGDMDFDGVPFSPADLIVWTVWYQLSCSDIPSMRMTEWLWVTADMNCDGMPTIGDTGPQLEVMLGIRQPFECEPSAQSHPNRPYEPGAVLSGPFAVEVGSHAFPTADTVILSIVLTAATEPIGAFQFHLEYNPDGLEYAGAELGSIFEHVPAGGRFFAVNHDVTGPVADISLVGSPLIRNQVETNPLPAVPTILASLKFHVPDPESVAGTEVKFVWNHCGENSLSISLPYEYCGWWPEYLAVSGVVSDSRGNDITDYADPYGGAGNECLVGGEMGVPVRALDLTGGWIGPDPLCCHGRVGDANGDGSVEPTISDVSTIIDILFITSNPSPFLCWREMDVNQSGGCDPGFSDVTIVDISWLIDYLFITGPILGLPDCLECP